jgi:hypothetical protein
MTEHRRQVQNYLTSSKYLPAKSTMAYTRIMGQQPWWFQLLAAGSDESDDENYEPRIYRVEIDSRASFLCIHTDDCDGVCEDPRDGKRITDAFDRKWGVR